MTVEQDTPTTLVDEGCTLQVVVQMSFINDTVLHRDEDGEPIPNANGEIEMIEDTILARIISCWLDSARQIWHNQWLDPLPPHKWRCREVKFVFLPRMGWPTLPKERLHFHKIVVKYDMPGGSWVESPLEENPPAVPLADELRAYGEWDIDDRHEVVAHEIGHILNLENEYDVAGEQPSGEIFDPPDSEYHDLSQDPRCVMMSTQAHVVMPSEHVRSIVEDLDAPLSFRCCSIFRPFELIRAIYQWFRGPVPLHTPPGGHIPFPDPGPDPPDDFFDLIDTARGSTLARIGNWVGSHSVFRVGTLRDRVLDQQGSSSRQRWLAAIALGQAREVDHPQALDALEKALGDPDISVKMLAARSLHRLGSRKGVPALIGALSSDELMIREPTILARIYADRMLKLISGKTVGFLPYASESIRNQGIKHWKKWWASQPESNH